MLDLQEGHQYSLSTEDKNKTVIFVKLTDSALQSIEDYINSQNGSSSKPTIQFQDNKGTITLPLNSKPHKYGFTLSNIEGDGLHSSFQCLHHTSDSSMESLGFMFTKMQIHANEDIYEKTKCKVAAADQEQKNLCTKELQQTASRIGNKFSVKRPGLMHIPDKAHSPFIKPLPANFNKKSKVTSPTTLIKQPIRERIIHILAAKPYKKAEILLRLKREGISDKDKDKINDILVEVAKLRGNIFVLESHIWPEVKEDWEFSSNEELELIIKKKQQILKPKDVNGFTNQCTLPIKQKNASPVPDAAVKTANKKQRFSFNGAQINNNISESDSCVPNDKSLSNGASIHATTNGHSNGHISKQISSLLSRKKDSPLVKNSHLSMKGTFQLPRTQSKINGNIPSLQTSFLPAEHKETNGKNQEEMCMEITTNGTANGEHENRMSNGVTSNTVSVNKQTGHNNNPKNQVGRPSKRGSKINNDVSTLDKIKLYREHFREICPSSSYQKVITNDIITNGNVNKGSNSEISETGSNSVPVVESVPEYNFSEIQSKYTKVESLEQRSQYAKDFNDDYDEYLKLQTEMKEISEKFSTLFSCLNASAQDSPEYKKIKLEIGQEYKRTSQNSYIASRKKFEFLKAKLLHIRELIAKYDESIIDEN